MIKCLVYLKTKRNITKVKLCGNYLPLERGKHLGNEVEKKDGMKKDTLIKRVNYIQKNNELNQELFFANPQYKFETKIIFNSHFSGSSLFSREMEMVENSWTSSFKVMYNLPLKTYQ